jgi:hypothetical protein
MPRRLIVILTVLPANALASVILTVSLVAILGHALIAELSLGAIAVASKLALALATPSAAVLSPVYGALTAESLLLATLARLALSVLIFPVHMTMLMSVMFVVCHLVNAPYSAPCA